MLSRGAYGKHCSSPSAVCRNAASKGEEGKKGKKLILPYTSINISVLLLLDFKDFLVEKKVNGEIWLESVS
jgi:hypothetical protein